MKTCKECGNPLSHKQRKTNKFCGNDCRLKNLHRGRRSAGRFFNVVCWSEEEDAILRELYPDPKNTLSMLAEKLPGRTIRAIKHRTSDLRILRKERPRLIGPDNPLYGRKVPEDERRRMSERTKRWWNELPDDKKAALAQKLREVSAFKTLNKDPEFQRKRKAAWHASVKPAPNAAERKLDAIVQDCCPGEYRFTGDGTFIIDGLNPDWVNINGQKKIIELFGRSFHDPRVSMWPIVKRNRLRGRQAAFRKFGYRTLVIWDSDLKSELGIKRIVRRLVKFNSKTS